MPSSKFLQLLKFCLNDNNYFIYGDKIYNQTFGMPMGNPLSPTIADIILDDLLDNAINKLNNKNIHIKYITKYVDDILAIINLDDKDEILSTLNSHHPKIQFTMEVEENGEIAYLDTKLHHMDNKIIFDWYTKDTASGRLMNFHATQPKNQIINTAKGFISRVLNISDEQFHPTNKQKIIKILKNNSFPIKLIHKLIENTMGKLKDNNTNHNQDNTNHDKKFYSVKYVPGLTDTKNIKTTIESDNIRFAYKPNRTLNSIFTNIKAPIEKEHQSNVVYEIQCKGNDNESCELIYIGTTKRTLETRMKEHIMDITKMKEATALSQHILNTGHTADLEKVKILDKENIGKKRYTIESLRIQQKIGKTMNLKEDTNNIGASYRVAIN